MHWWLLLLAGLLEVGWAIGLKYTDGFTKPLPSLLTGAATLGIILLGEAATPGRLFFLAMLLVAVIGLKLTSGN